MGIASERFPMMLGCPGAPKRSASLKWCGTIGGICWWSRWSNPHMFHMDLRGLSWIASPSWPGHDSVAEVYNSTRFPPPWTGFARWRRRWADFLFCFFLSGWFWRRITVICGKPNNEPSSKSQFLWMGFQPSPNGRFIVGLPTLCVWIVR